MSIHTPPSQTVLEKLDLTRAKITRFESGIINDSWRVEKSNQEIFVSTGFCSIGGEITVTSTLALCGLERFFTGLI